MIERDRHTKVLTSPFESVNLGKFEPVKSSEEGYGVSSSMTGNLVNVA